jgi:group I intron endonuclease
MAIIYKTTCLINNKIYIGQSKYNKETYLGSGKIILNVIKKYGKENFTKEILIDGNYTQDEIDFFEMKFIKEFNSTNSNIGYNIRPGGNGNSESANRLISISNKSRVVSDETKKKISTSKIGKSPSEKTKKMLSESKIGNSYRKGKLHSELDKINISNGLKKHYQSTENRKISSNAAKQRISDGKCMEGVLIISSKENQSRATELARLKNIKSVLIKDIESKIEIVLDSLSACREYFNIKGNNSLIDCIRNNKIYRKKYLLYYI